MNRIFIILTALFIIAVVGIGIVLLTRSGTPAPVGNQQTPPVSSQSTYTVPVSGSEAAVQSAFQNEIAPRDTDNVKPEETIVARDWALQLWSGDNTGGEALLKYDAAQAKWVVVDVGGGSWNLEALIRWGVSRDVAEMLLEGRPY